MPSRSRAVAVAIISLCFTGTIPPVDSAVRTFNVPLTAAAELDLAHPATMPGDPDGSGTLKLSINLERRQVCYDFSLSGLDTPMMAHIHRGLPHHVGPSVVTLFTGMGSDELAKCIPWTNTRLAEIVAQPSNFYVNVYTTEFPDGALRGQLPAA